MNYLSDEKEENGSHTVQGDDLVTKTLASLARRTDRRRIYAYANVLLCVIFALCCIAGALLAVYVERTQGLPAAELDTKGYNGVLDWFRELAKQFLISFLPVALVFVCGFNRSAVLVCGTVCALAGAFCGALGVYMCKIAHIGAFLSDMICCGVYGFLIIHFCAVAVSFSHLVKTAPSDSGGMFDEDLKCYLNYFAATSSCVLALCAAELIVRLL